MAVAKVFKNGGSQAIRIPKEFRFQSEEVEIIRAGDGLLIRPCSKRPWPQGYWDSWEAVELEIVDPLPSKPVPDL